MFRMNLTIDKVKLLFMGFTKINKSRFGSITDFRKHTFTTKHTIYFNAVKSTNEFPSLPNFIAVRNTCFVKANKGLNKIFIY